MISTPQPGWLSTVAPGAGQVAIVAYAPSAISVGDIAILATLASGFLVIAVLLLLQLLKRSA